MKFMKMFNTGLHNQKRSLIATPWSFLFLLYLTQDLNWPGSEVIQFFFMLKSIKHDIYPAYQCWNAKNEHKIW